MIKKKYYISPKADVEMFRTCEGLAYILENGKSYTEKDLNDKDLGWDDE